MTAAYFSPRSATKRRWREEAASQESHEVLERLMGFSTSFEQGSSIDTIEGALGWTPRLHDDKFLQRTIGDDEDKENKVFTDDYLPPLPPWYRFTPYEPLSEEESTVLAALNPR